MTQIGPETAYELIRRLISSADEYKARYHGDGLPDVPDEPGCLPGRDEPLLRHQLPDADRVLHAVDGTGLRHQARQNWALARRFVSAQKALARIGVEIPEPVEEAVRAARRTKVCPCRRA
ncbi:MAG: hypothetical protein MZV49_25340 [Rhodopseudomonas palustris]|nr:hypothetical protein [Rhodopseudomonas palustris]